VSDPRAGRGRLTDRQRAVPDDRPRRPARPAILELATALLVVSGFLSFFTSIEAAIALSERQEIPGLLIVVSVLIGVGTIAVGIALRYGHWWLFGLNFVAIAAFLELTSGTVQGMLFGAVDLFVVVVLLAQRPWFQWRPEADRTA
jgi:hypothetical protein